MWNSLGYTGSVNNLRAFEGWGPPSELCEANITPGRVGEFHTLVLGGGLEWGDY